MGESLLQHWCAEGGVTANRAEHDQAGWDYLLEFPIELVRTDAALDKEPPPHQALVQVKATDAKTRSITVKLTNWLRLAKSPLPSFFLILYYGGRTKCQRAHLLHVDEQAIRVVLETLRRLSAQPGARTSLHTRYLPVRCTSDNELPTPSSAAFVKRLTSSMGPSQAEYVARKQALLRDVGYENARGELSIKVVVPEKYQRGRLDQLLVDFSIGALSSLEVTEAELWDVRFGLKGPEPERRFKGSRLEFVPDSGKPAEVVLRRVTDGGELRLPATVYAPVGIGSFVRPEDIRVRLAFPNASLILAPHPNSGQYDFNIPAPDRPGALKQLAQTARLLQFMADASASESRITIQADRFSLGHLDLTSSFQPPTQLLEWAKLVTLAQEVGSIMNLPPEATVVPLSLWHQAQALAQLHAVLTKDFPNARIALSVDSDTVVPDRPCCFPQLLAVEFEAYTILLVLVHLGPMQYAAANQHRDFIVAVDSTVVVRKQTLGHGEPYPESAPRLLDAAAAPYAATHYVVKWWADD